MASSDSGTSEASRTSATTSVTICSGSAVDTIADVALAIASRNHGAQVVGLDPSEGMLEVGRRKVARAKLEGRVRLVSGDAQLLPFPDDSFDACCIAFGIRNVPDRTAALSEMRRVTRPGGVVAVLELGEPGGGLFGWLARVHVHHVVPWLGALLSGASAYRYLRDSVAAFPAPDVFAALMRTIGVARISVRRLGFGAAHLYTGQNC